MWLKLCEMTWFNILSTFIKIKNHLNYFWSIFVFLNIRVHYICFHKMYSNLSFYKMKWNNLFSNILLRLYFDIFLKSFNFLGSISKYIAFLFIILCHISTLASKILATLFNKIPNKLSSSWYPFQNVFCWIQLPQVIMSMIIDSNTQLTSNCTQPLGLTSK
jgi:hypothetical protein